MMRKTLIAAAIAFAGLAQAADYETQLRNATKLQTVRAAACVTQPGGSCVVEITAVTLAADGKCSANVNPEYLAVRSKGAVTLLWRLRADGWSFREKDGILLKDTQGQIDDSRRATTTLWHAKDKVSQNVYIKYDLNLVSKDGKPCHVDPGLWNEPVPSP